MVLFNYLDSIENKDKFNFLVVIIISLFFATVLFPIDIRHIAGITLAVILVFYMNDRNLSTLNDFNRETEAKLNAIKNAVRTTPKIGGGNSNLHTNKSNVVGYIPNYLYLDVDIINLLFNILDLREYNTAAFLDIVWNIDNILKIEEDIKIGVKQCVENIEIARDHSNLALNHLQSLIITIPSIRVMNEKLAKNIKRLQLLLRRHIDNMYRICKTQQRNDGYSIYSRVLQNSGPRPSDITLSTNNYNSTELPNAPNTILNFDIFV